MESLLLPWVVVLPLHPPAPPPESSSPQSLSMDSVANAGLHLPTRWASPTTSYHHCQYNAFQQLGRRLPSHPPQPVAASASAAAGAISSVSQETLHSSLSSLWVDQDVSSTDGLKRATCESLQYKSGYLGGKSEKSPVHHHFSTSEEEKRGLGHLSPMEYLTRILCSRVYDVAVETPLEFAPNLSQRIGVNVWLKREDSQPVFSFKLRGAYNMMVKLSRNELDRGVICSSAGNHAQGVALAAKKLGCHAVIAMPVSTPEIKWRSVEKLGATVVLVGDSYDDTQTYAKQRAEQEGRTFVPPFDHPDVIVGQGTIGMEILRQLKSPLHAIFVPVGGGGLIAGIAAYVKLVRPEVKIIGVEPADANAMALSLHHGQRVTLEQVGNFADGVAVKVVGEETFRLCRELVDGVVLVSRDAICASIKDMFEEKRSILEPAGALSLAGAEAYCKYYGLKGESVVAITSGANMNFDRLSLITELARSKPAKKAPNDLERPTTTRERTAKYLLESESRKKQCCVQAPWLWANYESPR